MLITNILNTLFITCAVGTNITRADMIKTPQKQNAGITNTYSLNVEFQNEDFNRLTNINLTTDNPNHYIHRWIAQKDYTNSYISGRVITLQSEEWYEIGNLQTIWNTYVGVSNQKIGHVEGTAETHYIYVQQRATYIQIIPNNTNVDTSIDITRSLSMANNEYVETNDSLADVKKYMYTRTYTTTAIKMRSQMFYENQPEPFNDPETIYWKNNNLYDRISEIIYGIGGYISTLQENATEIEDTQGQVPSANRTYTITTSQEINIKPNNENYYIIYEEPKYTTTSTIPSDYNVYLNKGYNINQNTTITINGTNAVNPTTTEVIDVPSVMFDVLGMPFTFFSSAFNLTIFPGTPYELNFSVLALSLLAVAIFVFIIKLILGAMGGRG